MWIDSFAVWSVERQMLPTRANSAIFEKRMRTYFNGNLYKHTPHKKTIEKSITRDITERI